MVFGTSLSSPLKVEAMVSIKKSAGFSKSGQMWPVAENINTRVVGAYTQNEEVLWKLCHCRPICLGSTRANDQILQRSWPASLTENPSDVLT